MHAGTGNEGLACRRLHLMCDGCPGRISDRYSGRVQWVRISVVARQKKAERSNGAWIFDRSQHWNAFSARVLAAGNPGLA